MEYPAWYEKLTPEQRFLFTKTYTKHLASMGTTKRSNYTEKHIKNVIWDEEENCLKVYFNNGDWWHYSTNEEWY